MRIGTRASALALAQARSVAERLPGAEIVEISTSGDGRADAEVVDDKSRFVREIDAALLAGEVDLAVHSAKDVPGDLAEGIEIVAVPKRRDPRDAWIGRGSSIDDAAAGSVIGTASLRRRSQLLCVRPDLVIEPMRGNIDTRLRRRAEGDFDAIVLAAAGLERLGWSDEASFMLEPDVLTPAPGQGALAICTRAGEPVNPALSALDHEPSHARLAAERATVTGIRATCDTPLGVFAELGDGELRLRAYAGRPDGSEWVRDNASGDPADPEALGRRLAEQLLDSGAGEILGIG